jgi:methionyl aminopeptidase
MVTFDVGVTYKNHVCDSAFTIIMDEDNVEAKKISEVTYDSLIKSISVIKPGATTGDIGYEIEKIANEGGYEVIKDFGGHGCGNKVHEDPMILCYGSKGKGTKLEKNMVICIEPMLMTDSDEYIIDKKNK